MTSKKAVDYDLRIRSEIDHWTRHAGRVEQIWNWEGPIGRARFQRRLAFLARNLGPGMSCLELGCGTGLFTQGLTKTGADVTAIDITPQLLAKARQRAPRARVIEQDACRTDFPASGFDAVVGSSVLHHLDVDRALPEILKVLKPGGELRFTEPNYLNPHIFLERKVEFIRVRMAVSRFETAFLRGDLAGRLGRAGFSQIRIEPFDFLYPFLPEAFLPLLEKTGAVLERCPVLREIAGSLQISAVKRRDLS